MHGRKLCLLFGFCLLMILPACSRQPASTPLAATLPPMAAAPSATPLGNWQSQQAEIAVNPDWYRDLDTIARLLPGGASIQREQVWELDSDPAHSRVLAVPYEIGGGFSIALVGQVSPGLDASQNAGDYELLWSWDAVSMQPAVWKAVSQSPEDGAFFGMDQDQRWSLVYWNDLDPLASSVKAVVPVEHPTDFNIQFGDNGVFVRDGGRLVYAAIIDRRAVEQWAISPALGKDFKVAFNPDADFKNQYWMDTNADGAPELMIYWVLPDPPFTIVQALRKDGDQVKDAGELPAEVQAVWMQDNRFRSDLPLAYVAPDGEGKPRRWQIYRWKGDRFEPAGFLTRPAAPAVIVLGENDPLPALPADLYYKQDESWYRIPKDGGQPVPADQPPEVSQRCRSDEGFLNCSSRDGLARVIAYPLDAAGISAAIENVETGEIVDIKQTLIYGTASYSFSWSADDSLLLLAQGPFGAWVDRVNPATGARAPLVRINACGWDQLSCSSAQAATDPAYLPDGTLGFVVQSPSLGLFPPPGVYQMDLQGRLKMLAPIPYVSSGCGIQAANVYVFGKAMWSDDRTAFAYSGSSAAVEAACRGAAVILGVDGEVYDLSLRLPGAQEFLWQ